MSNDSTLVIGLDLGDQGSHLAMLDPDGESIEETRLPTTRAVFQRKFSSLPNCRLAMEVGASRSLP